MLRNSPAGSVTTTASLDQNNEREVRRLRLTLRPEDTFKSQKERRKNTQQSEEKRMNESWMKKNGLMQRERPPGRESPVEDKHSCGVRNGDGPRVYGVVQRTGDQQQQEVTARDWPVSHLRDEMKYIKEVRDSLEKVRERMYGQFGGMQQSMQKLSQELKLANSQRQYLEAEVKTGRQAMESFDQMNSSLITANLDLQKALLDSCNGRVVNRDEMKTLRSSFEKTEERLRERERQLAAAQAENQALKQQLESSQEASAQAVKEMNVKLQKQYEEKLQEQQRRHREEIQALQAQLEEYMRRLEEAEEKVKHLEQEIAQRDQRIIEVERLLDCMAQEKSQLTEKLCDCEKRLRTLNEDQVDSGIVKKSEQVQLQKEASELKERIKHLNDMVFCQQRKVKGMIEEVESLRASVAQKDMYISELLDRIAIVECENNELEDKLKYFMSVQSAKEKKPLTRDIGVGCDFPISQTDPRVSEAPILTRPAPPTPRLPSRLDYSLLRYTPLQYSSYLSSQTREIATSTTENTTESCQAETCAEEITSSTSSSSNSELSTLSNRARTSPSRIYTPFMKLMEITAKINID
ncbi:myocardial zonula adherens protein-like isoform X1 [Hoplias malabaricus]|uniref:myocardial zonula adherens protein-like isoform X1 n=2 Tax=Hoplias malabaricus TaxID=27720 RepID=UPI003461ADF5